MTKLDRILKKYEACEAARKWAKGKTPKQAWETCKRADWLLWIAEKIGVDQKKIVLSGCACARTALKYVPKGEDRPRIAIETTEAWTRGEASLEDVKKAANAAYAAEAATYAAYAAANAAVYAADAANAAARSAGYADDAAYAASNVVCAATNAAYAATYVNMAKLVREIITWNDVRNAVK